MAPTRQLLLIRNAAEEQALSFVVRLIRAAANTSRVGDDLLHGT